MASVATIVSVLASALTSSWAASAGVKNGSLGMSSWSVRIRAAVGLVIGLVCGFMLLVEGVESHRRWLVAIGLIVGAAGGAYAMTLRCPRCGTPIFKRKRTIDGIEVTYWGGSWVPRTCSHCGLRLP